MEDQPDKIIILNRFPAELNSVPAKLGNTAFCTFLGRWDVNEQCLKRLMDDLVAIRFDAKRVLGLERNRPLELPPVQEVQREPFLQLKVTDRNGNTYVDQVP